MPGKWKVDEIEVGRVMETTFWPNPLKQSDYRFRATHLDGKRAPKVVLSDDPRIRPGIPCMVKIITVRKTKRTDRGLIEVEFQQLLNFKPEGSHSKHS